MKLFKNILINSDKHLGDKNLIRGTRTEFASSKEHTNRLIEIHNEVVKDYHIVYDLGDIGSDKEEIRRFFASIKRPKKMILIKGNHDVFSNSFYEEFYDEVYSHPLYIHKRVVLSHHPIKVDDDVINIHGHTHLIKIDLPNYINVAVDLTKFNYFKGREIDKYFQSIPKTSTKFCEEWYKDIQRPMTNRKDLILNDKGLINPEETLKQIKLEKELAKFFKKSSI